MTANVKILVPRTTTGVYCPSTSKGTGDLYTSRNEAETLINVLQPDQVHGVVKAVVKDSFDDGTPMYVQLNYFVPDASGQSLEHIGQQVISSSSLIEQNIAESQLKDVLSTLFLPIHGQVEALNQIFEICAKQKYGEESPLIAGLYNSTMGCII
mgnify:CR=1 FL=1